MRSRQSLIEMFSTFLQFDAERWAGWASDPKLRRSMQHCLEQLQRSEREEKENFWALYWHKLWKAQAAPVAGDARSTTLARSHLTAYLQESCYWTAKKTSATLASTQYALSDCFQMAISAVDTVLKGFNPTQGYSLKNYASAIFSSALRNELRQRQEIDVSTTWALLRRLSQKRLVESLQQAGTSKEEIASYVLAWKCFKTLYAPAQATATRQLPPPDSATKEAIANLYNKERGNELSPSAPKCSADILEKWLLTCAKAARSYLYPTQVSLNAPTSGEDSDEFLSDLRESVAESLLTELIDREEEQNRLALGTQMRAALTAALDSLDSQAQTLMQLYYGQGLTQQQIARQLEMKQYTVSRRLTKSRETLLLALAKWSQNALHISLASNVLKDISQILEGWLNSHYRPSELSSEME
jgi:RNA polymerase sigma factor (sigma-70 family)